MFTDKFRIFKLILPIFFICVLVLYASIQGPLFYPGYKEARLAPQQFIGKNIYIGGKMENIHKDFFYIKIDKKFVKINSSVGEGKQGYLLVGKAIYLFGGSLQLSEYHTSNLRIYKIILSLIPIAIIGYLFSREFSFDFKHYLFINRKKQHARFN